MSTTLPGVMSCATSCSRSITSMSRMSWADSTLARVTPDSSGHVTPARSSRVSPLDTPLARTWTVWPAAASLGMLRRTTSRAAAFSPGGTESSRSSTTTSAAKARAFSIMFSRMPGTKMSVRYRSK